MKFYITQQVAYNPKFEGAQFASTDTPDEDAMSYSGEALVGEIEAEPASEDSPIGKTVSWELPKIGECFYAAGGVFCRTA